MVLIPSDSDTCMTAVMIMTPVQWAILLAVIVLAVLTIRKDSRSLWLGMSLIVVAVQIFLSMHTYSNSFNVVFRIKEVFNYGYTHIPPDKLRIQSNWLVWLVLVLDVSFILFFCLHFIRNYNIGKKHLIAALSASLVTRITGYFAGIVRPTLAVSIWGMTNYDSESITPVVRHAPRLINLEDRLIYLTSLPRIMGMAVLIVLFISLILLSKKTKQYEPQRKNLFLFPIFILTAELIRYMASALCEYYFDVFADSRFAVVSLLSCAACLFGAVYIFKTRSRQITLND